MRRQSEGTAAVITEKCLCEMVTEKCSCSVRVRVTERESTLCKCINMVAEPDGSAAVGSPGDKEVKTMEEGRWRWEMIIERLTEERSGKRPKRREMLTKD